MARHAARLRAERQDVVRIIWFGSWTTGLPGAGSDVDLCVVVSHSDLPRRQRVPDFLPVGFPVGVDLVVYTESEFAALRGTQPAWLAAIEAGRDV